MTEHRLEGATCSCGDWEPPLGSSITRSFDRHLLAVRPAPATETGEADE